jgi:hypothetical protein
MNNEPSAPRPAAAGDACDLCGGPVRTNRSGWYCEDAECDGAGHLPKQGELTMTTAMEKLDASIASLQSGIDGAGQSVDNLIAERDRCRVALADCIALLEWFRSSPENEEGAVTEQIKQARAALTGGH